jgi:hypothetical protein
MSQGVVEQVVERLPQAGAVDMNDGVGRIDTDRPPVFAPTDPRLRVRARGSNCGLGWWDGRWWGQGCEEGCTLHLEDRDPRTARRRPAPKGVVSPGGTTSRPKTVTGARHNPQGQGHDSPQTGQTPTCRENSETVH